MKLSEFIQSKLLENNLPLPIIINIRDSVAALEAKNESIIKANHSLIDTQARLQAECGKLESKGFIDDETISKLKKEIDELKECAKEPFWPNE